MAVVALAEAAVPEVFANPPEALAKAAAPGRTRAVAEAAWAEATADPLHAGAVLSSHLRAARHLHSRERRLVAAGLYALLRHHRLLGALVGSQEPEALWRAWLDVQAGSLDAWAGATSLLEGLDPAEAVGLAASVRPAAAAQLLASLGEHLPAFLAASNRRAPLVLRANPLRAGREAVLERLERMGIRAAPHPLARHGIEAKGRFDAMASPLYRRGWVEIQDPGSQLLAEVVGARPGDRVLDAAAGAGGKTAALAADMEGRGRLVAADVREAALVEVRKRVRRAGAADMVQTVVLEGGQPYPESLHGRFDKVLVDAPCTGTGTLRRQPELRWRWTAESMEGTARLQGEILARAAACVRPGGSLVYATCSVLSAENEAQVEAFLAATGDFALVPLAEALGQGRCEELGQGGPFFRVAPHTHGTDGFFAAVLRRAGAG